MKVSISKGDKVFETTINSLDFIKDDIKNSIEKKKPKTILIKPNLLIPHKNNVGNVNVDVVRAVISHLNKLGRFRIIVGEGVTTAFGVTSNAFKENGYLELEKEFSNVKLKDLNQDDIGKSFTGETLKGKMNLGVYETAINADYVISIAKLKTHNHVIATLSLKNMFGCISQSHRHAMHGGFDPGFVKLDPETYNKEAMLLNYNLIKLSKTVYPDLAVIDSMVAMEGNGPDEGDPVNMNLVLASTDPLSADLTATKIIGEEPNNIGYLRFLCEDMKPEIQIVGEELDSVKRKFRMHKDYKMMLINYKDLLKLLGR